MKIDEILHDRGNQAEIHTILRPRSRWAHGKIVQWMALQGKLCGVRVETQPEGDQALRVSISGDPRAIENFKSSSHEISGYVDGEATGDETPDVPQLFPRAGD